MKTRCITTPEGKRVSIGAYVKAWKSLKAMDPETEISGWQWYPVKARDVLRDIAQGVQDRINQAIPYNKRGNN